MVLNLLTPCYNQMYSCLISSVLFGLSHFHHFLLDKKSIQTLTSICAQFVFTFIFGLFSALMFFKTNYIITTMILHSLCNLFGLPDFKRWVLLFWYLASLFIFFLFFCSKNLIITTTHHSNNINIYTWYFIINQHVVCYSSILSRKKSSNEFGEIEFSNKNYVLIMKSFPIYLINHWTTVSNERYCIWMQQQVATK